MEFNLSDSRKLALYSDSLAVLQDRLFFVLLKEEMDVEEFNPSTFTPGVDAGGVTIPSHAHIHSLGLQVQKIQAKIATLRGE